jgi:hypothetical protein
MEQRSRRRVSLYFAACLPAAQRGHKSVLGMHRTSVLGMHSKSVQGVKGIAVHACACLCKTLKTLTPLHSCRM